MKKTLSIFCIAIAIVFSLTQTSCNESTLVGSDLLGSDVIGIAFTDTLRIETTTVREDKVVLPSFEQYYTSYPIGILADPVFGESVGSAYMQFLPLQSVAANKFTGATIDSVVLGLQYDTLSYGNITEQRKIEVYRLEEALNAAGTVFSDYSIKTSATPIATVSFIARNSRKDTVRINSPFDSTKVKLVQHLRIKLDNSIGQELISMDSVTFNTNSKFLDKFKGIYLKPVSVNKGMVNFKLNYSVSSNSVALNPTSNISVYYRDAKNVRSLFVFYPGPTSQKASNFKQAYSNTIVAAATTPSPAGDSLVYVQGMCGTNIKVKFPTAKYLRNKGLIINKVELEMYAKNDGSSYPYAPQLIIDTDNDGKPNGITDVGFGSQNNFAVFGGRPVDATVNGVALKKYTFSMSDHFQKMVDNSSYKDEIFISLFTKNEMAGRTIFYGAKHPKYPAKVKIYYTKVQ